MAQSDRPAQEPASTTDHAANLQSLWRRLFGRDNGAPVPTDASSKQGSQQVDDPKPGLIRRVSRKVVPGLPRAQTFKRQQSELRDKLEPVQPTPAERRAVSVDRRLQASQNGSLNQSNPRSSAPDFIIHSFGVAPSIPSISSVPSLPTSPLEEKMLDAIEPQPEPPAQPDAPVKEPEVEDLPHVPDAVSIADAHSVTTSQYDAMIHDELERVWILNLSMHFRDKSKREKFFVTYRERPTLWRRVTVSLDYRNAPENSLELELAHTKFQRDKSAKIYEAIRESLVDIQFYDTVTNLKLQTTEGRLHVHVVEDVNEIIHYPSARTIQHMRCNRVKERDIEFDSHMSGFVYKVRVNDEVLIKKEIPGPDTVDEFLYEINALSRLKHSNSVIKFYGVIVDDRQEYVKGLLISYAEQGALVDLIYDSDHGLPWPTRERWARQIVQGLSEIHEAGFVQGDFTLSNIVVDGEGDAKIIDINRRGCPVGWEPPEATPLIENNQRISMYIGVKSDLYQLGMVLWALATQEDEPEAHGRPLRIGPDPLVPIWYRRIVEICLSEDPRMRMQALHLLSMMPEPEMQDPSKLDPQYSHHSIPSISVDDDISRHEYLVDDYHSPSYPWVRPVHPPTDWSYVSWGPSYVNPTTVMSDDAYFYPTRGRSPPSPLPSTHGECPEPRFGRRWPASYDASQTTPSVDDTAPVEVEEGRKSVTPRTSKGSLPAAQDSTEAERVSGLSQVGDVDGPVRDIAEKNLETSVEVTLPNGSTRPDAEVDIDQRSDNMTTPVQEPGKPHDEVTEVDLASQLEGIGEHELAAPGLGLPESGRTEPEQERQRSEESFIPSRGSHPEPDPASLVPARETDGETEAGLNTVDPGAHSFAKQLDPGGQAQPIPEIEINGRADDEAGGIITVGEAGSPTDIRPHSASSPSRDPIPNPYSRIRRTI